MPRHDLFSIFTSILDDLGFRYFITGSVACIVYGEPRMTHDIDLVVEIGSKQAHKIVEAFDEENFYCPPVEVIRIEGRRLSRGHFNIIHHETGFKADFYTKSADPIHHWAMDNRRQLHVGDHNLWLAPPEYVILRKLEFYQEGKSDKHLRDIKGMLSQGFKLDMDVLDAWLAQRGLGELWQTIQPS